MRKPEQSRIPTFRLQESGTWDTKAEISKIKNIFHFNWDALRGTSLQLGWAVVNWRTSLHVIFEYTSSLPQTSDDMEGDFAVNP